MSTCYELPFWLVTSNIKTIVFLAGSTSLVCAIGGVSVFAAKTSVGQDALTQISSTLNPVFSYISTSVSSVSAMTDSWNSVTSAVESAASVIGNGISDSFNEVVNEIKKIQFNSFGTSYLKPAVTGIVTGMNATAEGFTAAQTKVETGWEFAKSKVLPSVYKTLKGLGKKAADGVKNFNISSAEIALKDLGTNLTTKGETILDIIKYIPGATKNIGQILSAFLNS